jgi:transposase
MKTKQKKAFPVLYPDAAGVDISSKEHYVAVNPEKAKEPIRKFGAYTEDLHAIVRWLGECGVDTVAMEATGIYWVSLFLMLEEAGFEVILVTAKHVKNVRGKKTDMSDAEWIRQLHSCGLLSPSFQPDAFTRTLRSYMRHRKNLLEMSATHIRMMHKALEQMNIKLQHVITDITGKSGQLIVEAIIAGQRDPEILATFCDGRIKASKKPDIIKSLHGVWKDEHVFELRQSFDMYHIYHRKIRECDLEIEKLLSQKAPLESPVPKMLVKSNKNNLNFDAKAVLQHITGTDLTQIFGITESNAIEILSEVGFDLSRWPTAKHFVSWLNLAPNNKISGGRLLSSKIPRKKNKAGQMFKMAAFSVQRSKNWLAAFYHRLKYKSGTPQAIVATAKKIATIFYKMMVEKTPFSPIPLETYNESFNISKIKRLRKQANNLGYQLVETIVT